MRVLLLTDSDVFAGTERHIYDLAQALRADFSSGNAVGAPIEVRVACPVPAPLAACCSDAQIGVVAIPKRGLVDFNAVRILRRALKSRRIDIIHAHNGRTALAAALAVTLARRGRFLMTQHFLTPNHATQSGVKGAVSAVAHAWVSRRAAKFVAISGAVRDTMLERGEVISEKIVVVLNGVPDAANRVLDSRQSTRENFGAGERPLVVCAARLASEKGLETLISAIEIVRQSCPEVLCLVAGEGDLHDALQQQIDAAQLGENFRLLGFQDNVFPLVRAADLFVLPSLNEPFGLSIIEAMALEKPVVATRAGGPLEIVADEESGILVAPSNAAEMARAISRLLDDETLRAQMGVTARARYCELFTAKRMAHEMAKTYAELI